MGNGVGNPKARRENERKTVDNYSGREKPMHKKVLFENQKVGVSGKPF